MSDIPSKAPSRGRLFKLFTDIGPYFRKIQSTENTFFFDCLEICVDDKEEPEDRVFLGWWLVLTRNDATYTYERFNGLYDNEGNWVATNITAPEMKQLDLSFDVFTTKLNTLIDGDIGAVLKAS